MMSRLTLHSVICLLIVLPATSTIVTDFHQFVFGKTICCATPLNVLFGISPLDCVSQCLSRQHCTAVSYQRKSLQCKLFDIDSTSASFEEDDPSYIMIFINQWSENLISPCRRHLCSGFTKCAVHTDGTPHCVQSDTHVNRWSLIYETDNTGGVISGKVDDLIAAIQSAAVIRVYMPSWNQTFNIDTTTIDNMNRSCSQSLFQVAKKTWNTFSEKATRVFHMFCESGFYHKSQHYLGGTSRPGNPDEFGFVGMKWFTRHCYEHLDTYPIYCINEQGLQSCGSHSELLSAILQGSEVRLHVNRRTVAHVVEQIIFKNGVIGAQMLRESGSIVHVTPNNKLCREFETTNPFWRYTILSSDSTQHVAIWYVGKHTSKPYRENKRSVDWFVDMGWSAVYSHDKNGYPLKGSVDRLRASVIAGKRIRMVLNGNVAGEPDSLSMESNGNVTAQLLNQISISDQSHFQTDAYWFWQMISSTGFVNIIRMYLGSNARKSSANSLSSVNWYADTRPWRKLLTTSDSGNATMGSKYELTRSLKSGGMLRLVVTFSNGTILALSPDNIEFYREEVAAQFVRYVGHMDDSGSRKRVFPVMPYWNLIMVTTEGSLISSLWVVGENVKVSNESVGVSTAWFVN